MPGRVFERKKRRLPCDVVYDGQYHSGLVIDLSPGGLFIQTNAKASPGERMDVKLSIPGETRKLALQVEVVRKFVVPPPLVTIAHGGVGVRILSAPENYYRFMESLGVGADPGEFGSHRAKERRSRHEEAKPAPEPLRRYRVRVKQIHGPRSRAVEVDAASEDAARAQVLADLGEGWTALAVEPLSDG